MNFFFWTYVSIKMKFKNKRGDDGQKQNNVIDPGSNCDNSCSTFPPGSENQ